MQLAWVAHAYNPVIVTGCVASLVMRYRREGPRALRDGVSRLAVGLAVIYLVMGLDFRYRVWPGVGLDYSTHTAFAYVLVCYLCLHGKTARSLWLGSFALYLPLMIYQGYHTPADIVTTLAAVGPIVTYLMWWKRPWGRDTPDSGSAR